MEGQIKKAMHDLGTAFPDDPINIEVNYYYRCRENRRTYTVYVPSIGAAREENKLADAVARIMKMGGKDA
ncbi:MAG: hypothetical protein WC455_21370 [Dehalococcoidia bacterium]